MTYAEKLRDPRWQRKRLEVLERDGWRCRLCQDDESTLHVHHLFYLPKRDPWDYPDDSLIAVCKQCHEDFEEKARALLQLVGNSPWIEIEDLIGYTIGTNRFWGRFDPVQLPRSYSYGYASAEAWCRSSTNRKPQSSTPEWIDDEDE